jgi:hypothetical protein
MQANNLFLFCPPERVRPVSCGDVRFLRLASQLKPQEKVNTDSLSELHALREKQVREEITKRLRSVCVNFPQEDFDRLVKKMAERQVRDERRLVW